MPEHQQCEYKEQWKDDWLQTICAFANTEGGRLYIGVADDGRVVGCTKTRKLLTDIPNKVNNALGMVVSVQLRFRSDAMDNQDLIAPETEKEYLEITVNAQIRSAPVTYKGIAYRRSGSATLRLEGDNLAAFIKERLGQPWDIDKERKERQWDSEKMPEAKLRELDPESFLVFARNAIAHGRRTQAQLDISNQQLLQDLHLLENGALTRAAVLLFHGTPNRWFRKAYVRLARFKGAAELLYQDELHGSLLCLAEQTVDILFTKYLAEANSDKGGNWEETSPYPPAAVREAIYNALIHSRYEFGNAIRIRVEDDRLSITNDGELPSGYTPNLMREERFSDPKNPLIGKIFYEAGFVEQWGRGMTIIYEECHRRGLMEPTYTCHNGTVTVTFQMQQDPAVKTKSQLCELILKMIAANPRVTLPELAAHSGVPLRKLRSLVYEMRQNGLLTREGSNRAGVWRILPQTENN